MNIELLPIGTHDHPEPNVMRWSELEIAAIRSYAQRCVLHDRNRGGQRLHCLAYDIANESAASDALELEAADELDRMQALVAELDQDAKRYRWLRQRDLETIGVGGVFAGMTPENIVLNGDDLDNAIDAALAKDGA